MLFDVALASLPHGLCIVDADRRLVVCNKRYADMYGIPAELTKPGTPMSSHRRPPDRRRHICAAPTPKPIETSCWDR